MKWLYPLTVFASAFLLFLIQPLVAKYLTPWFGGSAAVWTTSMMFFIVVLLLGYAYVHFLTAYVPPRQQAAIHLGLIGVSWLVLFITTQDWPVPLLPSIDWQPTQDESPAW
ncbi:MAG: ferrichrome ABC transporter permease, partial [Patescibacteria group bacterium]